MRGEASLKSVDRWMAEVSRRQAAVREAQQAWRTSMLRMNDDGYSLAEIAGRTGYTRSRVQQMIAQARREAWQ